MKHQTHAGLKGSRLDNLTGFTTYLYLHAQYESFSHKRFFKLLNFSSNITTGNV